MTEEDEEDLKNMLDGIMHILAQQQIKMMWVLDALKRADIEVRMDTIH
jgi:hypothetical protein